MNGLSIYLPPQCRQEAQYILTIFFTEFFGLKYRVAFHEGNNFLILGGEKTLKIAATFFVRADRCWLQPESLPQRPSTLWDTSEIGLDMPLVEPLVPIIEGEPVCEIQEDHIFLGLDVFGSAFFMLSRYEECVIPDRDHYGRFPARSSLAQQEGFLMRPIINEYLEILWACIKRLWPGLERRGRAFRMIISADVDSPYNCGTKQPHIQAKQVGRDLLKRRDPVRAARGLANFFLSKWGNYSLDPHFQHLFWMMDVNQAAGNKVAFNFIVNHSDPRMDGCYSIDEPAIRRLVRQIHQRGHEIGLHPSFNTFRNAATTIREADQLREVMKAEGVDQDWIGGRQHYLRWENPITARNWEAAGMAYDSTLGYAEHPGFRCGICYEYPLYDVLERKRLNLRERPLVVMECSVMSELYMNFGNSDASLHMMIKLKDICRAFHGDFTLLWHNSSFDSEPDREIYRQLII